VILYHSTFIPAKLTNVKDILSRRSIKRIYEKYITRRIFSFHIRAHRVGRVPGFLSSRPNWLPPPPHSHVSVAPLPLVLGGGTHSLAGEGAGEQIHSDDGTDTLVR
jgi:hypothetical protein